MIVVDSNTWVDFFNGASTPWVARLDVALESEEDIAVLPIIITEVLQGFRSAKGFEQARVVLTALPIIQPDISLHVNAARLFRTLRGKGVTVRGAVDCIIAATCIELDALLLSPDSDFRQIAAHSPLLLWSA
jgi:predicted nucleic acid-binding protein